VYGPPRTLYKRWKRLSGSFLHRFLAFQAQALQQRGLPKEFVDKLRKAERRNACAITGTRWPGSRFFGLNTSLLRGPSHGSAAPCIHANRPMKRSSKTSIHSTHNTKHMGLTSPASGTRGKFSAAQCPTRLSQRPMSELIRAALASSPLTQSVQCANPWSPLGI
jgi:hypothetical protein